MGIMNQEFRNTEAIWLNGGLLILIYAYKSMHTFDSVYMVFAEYYAKKRDEGKSHRVACSHVIKNLIKFIFILEKNSIDFDSSKLR